MPHDDCRQLISCKQRRAEDGVEFGLRTGHERVPPGKGSTLLCSVGRPPAPVLTHFSWIKSWRKTAGASPAAHRTFFERRGSPPPVLPRTRARRPSRATTF